MEEDIKRYDLEGVTLDPRRDGTLVLRVPGKLLKFTLISFII
jgi:hypothetical protein